MEPPAEVDWQTLEHAYGSAADVPDQLQQLLSPDASQRELALYQLSSNLYHQGSIYEATIHAVPWLVQALESGTAPDPGMLLELLTRFASGGSYHDNHQHLPFFAERSQTQQFQEQLERELGWVRTLQAELASHQATYLNHLGAQHNPSTRLQAATLLAVLGERSRPCAGGLLEAYLAEEDPSCRANLLLAVGQLDPARLDFEQLWEREQAHPLVRWVLARCWLETGGAGPKVLAYVCEVFRAPDAGLERDYENLPLAGDFLGDMAVLLGGTSERESLVTSLLLRVQDRGPCPFSRAYGLLVLALTTLPPQPDQLTALEKDAIRAVALRAWPDPTTTHIDFVDILRVCGLPTNRGDMEVWLGAPMHPPQRKAWKPWQKLLRPKPN